MLFDDLEISAVPSSGEYVPVNIQYWDFAKKGIENKKRAFTVSDKGGGLIVHFGKSARIAKKNVLYDVYLVQSSGWAEVGMALAEYRGLQTTDAQKEANSASEEKPVLIKSGITMDDALAIKKEFNAKTCNVIICKIGTLIRINAEDSSKYDVYLTEYDAAQKTGTIKKVRGYTGLGLGEAKKLVEATHANGGNVEQGPGTPGLIEAGVSIDVAEAIKDVFAEINAVVVICKTGETPA